MAWTVDVEGLGSWRRGVPADRFVPYRWISPTAPQVDRVLAELLDGLEGRCDILVNNAGVSRLRSLADTEDELLDWMFAVNFIAAFRITRALLPALRASGRAAVVNIASELALVGQPDYSAYCATKGAMLAWSRALALELAAEGMRVNAVCPGPVDTATAAGGIRDASRIRRRARKHRDRGDSARASRLCRPIWRRWSAFSPATPRPFVTGAAWCVDGGKTAR